jgi:signal transduction histidine kinase
VFLNLIGNAIQAMPEGGELAVYVREITDWKRNLRGTAASIIDSGKGIHPEVADQLFQPFFTTKSTKGTGLGLWISNGIVQKYDGRITCRSVRGRDRCVTSFRVFLPGSRTYDLSARRSDEAESVAGNVMAGSRHAVQQA